MLFAHVSPESILPAGVAATRGAPVFAMYAAARTLPLAVLAFVAIYKRSRSGLLVLGALAGCVQFLDALVGLYQHDAAKIRNHGYETWWRLRSNPGGEAT